MQYNEFSQVLVLQSGKTKKIFLSPFELVSLTLPVYLTLPVLNKTVMLMLRYYVIAPYQV